MSAANNNDYYQTLLAESEVKLTDEVAEPEYGPVEVREVYGDNAAMHLTVVGIDGYSSSEIRTIIEKAFKRSSALKLPYREG